MRVLLAVLVAVCTASAPARGESTVVDALGARLAEQQLGFSAGWGFGLPFPDPEGEIADTHFVALTPRWALPLCDRLGEGAFRGRLAFLAEGTVLLQHAPRDGHAAGGKMLLRYLVTGADGEVDRVTPYLEGGGGGLYLDLDLEEQRDGFNFSIVGGLGLLWPLSERLFLDTSVRLHHVSNAGTRRPNSGINSLVLAAGFAWRPILR